MAALAGADSPRGSEGSGDAVEQPVPAREASGSGPMKKGKSANDFAHYEVHRKFFKNVFEPSPSADAWVGLQHYKCTSAVFLKPTYCHMEINWNLPFEKWVAKVGCSSGFTLGVKKAVADMNVGLADGAKIRFVGRGNEPLDGPVKGCKKLLGLKVKEHLVMNPHFLWGEPATPFALELTNDIWKATSDRVASCGRVSSAPAGVTALSPGSGPASSPGPATPTTPAAVSGSGSRARTVGTADLPTPVSKRPYRRSDLSFMGVEVVYASAVFPPMKHIEFPYHSEFTLLLPNAKEANLTLWYGTTPRDLILEYNFTEADCEATNLSPGMALYEVKSKTGMWQLTEPTIRALTIEGENVGLKIEISRGMAIGGPAASVPGTPRA